MYILTNISRLRENILLIITHETEKCTNRIEIPRFQSKSGLLVSHNCLIIL